MNAMRDQHGHPGLIRAFFRAETVILSALTAFASLILFCLWIADVTGVSPVAEFDRLVLITLHPDARHPSDPLGPLWLDHAAADFTSAGSISVLVFLSLTAGGFLLVRRRYLDAGVILMAFFGGLLISEGLKGFFGRERPPDIYRAAEVLNASFPSGHALLAAGVYLTMAVIIARQVRARGERIYIAVGALALVILIGMTRIYLGVHWATDVLAGWVAGGAWASLCCLAAYLLRLRMLRQ